MDVFVILIRNGIWNNYILINLNCLYSWCCSSMIQNHLSPSTENFLALILFHKLSIVFIVWIQICLSLRPSQMVWVEWSNRFVKLYTDGCYILEFNSECYFIFTLKPIKSYDAIRMMQKISKASRFFFFFWIQLLFFLLKFSFVLICWLFMAFSDFLIGYQPIFLFKEPF